MSAVRDELVWIDCEMTGLDLKSDKLIEIAALVTDADLNVPAIGDLSLGQILSAEQAAAERKNRSIRTGKVEDMPC